MQLFVFTHMLLYLEKLVEVILASPSQFTLKLNGVSFHGEGSLELVGNRTVLNCVLNGKLSKTNIVMNGNVIHLFGNVSLISFWCSNS